MQTLTKEYLSRYVGGMFQLVNPVDGYLLCGKIKEIKFEDGKIDVDFDWFAEGEIWNHPTTWVARKNSAHQITVARYTVSIRPPGTTYEEGITFSYGEEETTFSPPSSRPLLDAAEVGGLLAK